MAVTPAVKLAHLILDHANLIPASQNGPACLRFSKAACTAIMRNLFTAGSESARYMVSVSIENKWHSFHELYNLLERSRFLKRGVNEGNLFCSISPVGWRRARQLTRH